jgi:hypothetical protein
VSAWWAIVGVRASELIGGVSLSSHDCCRALEREYGLEELRLVPGTKNLVEHRRSEPLNLYGWETFVSWPIIVIGPGDATRFMPEFNSLVHRVAALLSIAWEEPWCLRHAAQDVNQSVPGVPDSEPHPFPWRVGTQEHMPRVSVPLPDLVPHGSVALQRCPVLRRCVGSWHQSLLAHTRSPTLAAVGYVGVLEALTQTDWGRANVSGESSKDRVAAIAAAAASENELFILGSIRKLYAKRSSAVHAATVLGVEDQPGTLFDLGAEHYGADPDRHRFVFRELAALRSVSRTALETALMYRG